MTITEKQSLVLAFLKKRGGSGASSADIGAHLSRDRVPPLKAQGAGWLGGRMAWALQRRGLVRLHWRPGFSSKWLITIEGRKALDQQENPV